MFCDIQGNITVISDFNAGVNPFLVGAIGLKIMSAYMAGTKGLVCNSCMAVCYN